MALPRPAANSQACPKYLRLARGFERQLRSGTLRVGDRLPSVRQLKAEHQISVSTAVGCYLWLERQGYIRARAKSGFYVARAPVPDGPAPAIASATLRPVAVRHVVDADVCCEDRVALDRTLDVGPAVLGPELLPSHRLNRSVRLALGAFTEHAVRYDEPAGALRLRRQIARQMFRQGTTCTADDVLITSGQTEALNLAIQAVAKTGDVIAVESPGCYDILRAIELLGLRALEVPHVLHHGVDLAALAAAARRHRIKAVITNASCHNPLGDCTSEASKAALVEFAAGEDIAIIEGDTFGDLVFSGDRPTTLKAHDRTGQVIQCASFAHYVAPGFNLGWISPGRWHAEVERLRSIGKVAHATLPQLAMAEFLESGALERHLKHLRVVLWRNVEDARAEVLRTFPDGTRVSSPEGGFVLWIQLPGGYDGSDVARRAAAAGINILPGEMFSPNRRYQDCIRINCGHPFDRVRSAIRRIGALLRCSGQPRCTAPVGRLLPL